MEYIKEPDGVDFVIQSKNHWQKKQEKDLSEYIAKRKLEIKRNPRKAYTKTKCFKT